MKNIPNPVLSIPRQVNLPKFRCFKTVEAFKIGTVEQEIWHAGNGQAVPSDTIKLFSVDGELSVVVPAAYGERHSQPLDHGTGRTTLVGGYYVRYEDGYESWSPQEAFEAGYKPMGRNNPTPRQQLLRASHDLDLALSAIQRRDEVIRSLEERLHIATAQLEIVNMFKALANAPRGQDGANTCGLDPLAVDVAGLHRDLVEIQVDLNSMADEA